MELHDHTHSPSTGTTDGARLLLTEAAATAAKAAMQREGLTDAALRVSVLGGGCSGFQYNLGFDRELRSDDIVVEQLGIRIVVDPQSIEYVHGTTLDYVSSLHGGGFKFLNPNATRTCGCGSSFSA